MRQKLLMIAMFAALFIMPFVRADIYTPYLAGFYQVSATILLIPIVLLEGALAYFLFRKNYNIKVNWGYSLLIFLVANVVSALIGGFLSVLLPFGSKNITLVYHLLLIPAFVASFLIEMPVIYLFIKKKTEEAWKISALTSLLTNLLSYALMFVFMVLFR